jgi:hypothetical protein
VGLWGRKTASEPRSRQRRKGERGGWVSSSPFLLFPSAGRAGGGKPTYLTTSLLRPAIWRNLRRFLPSGCSTHCRVRLRGPQVVNTTSHTISQSSLRDVVRYAG